MVSGFSYTHPSSPDSRHFYLSEDQLQPQTENRRCAYALFVDAGQHAQGTLGNGDFVFLRPSDHLDVGG
jgi:hypothetical protein